ncbi:unnamed protein product [Spirodela intermedia]|uniref:Gag protein n=1 Tax=Spirodela intermedia TaxID=51605 RepID=A0ABN7EAC6_SPIIN|nr:unnamed protein product [Spirodela intermedia]
MAVPTSLVVPVRLTRENFSVWKTTIVPLLNGYDLQKYIDQDPPAATIDDQPNPAYQAWWRNEQQVLGFINSSLSEIILSKLGQKTTTKELWTAIQKTYSSSDRSRIMDLQRHLHNFVKGDSCIEEYIQRFKRLAEELALAGKLVEEISQICVFLRGLGPKYSTFDISINANLNHLTFEDIISVFDPMKPQ